MPNHIGRDWLHFHHLDLAESGEQVGQACGGVSQHARSLAGVKQIGDVDAKVALQPHYVAVRAMQHLHHLHVMHVGDSKVRGFISISFVTAYALHTPDDAWEIPASWPWRLVSSGSRPSLIMLIKISPPTDSQSIH